MTANLPDWERGISEGIREATRHLDAIRSNKQLSNRVVRGYAAGIATGVMRWCLKKYGPRLTYDLFVGLADEALSEELEKGD
jgi:hypothetical protein